MIYFTADTHFGHYNVIRFCDRPFASAEDQANVIAFLASDLSRCITGQAIITDNGRCL